MIKEAACAVDMQRVHPNVTRASEFIRNTWNVGTKAGVQEARDALEVSVRLVECDNMKLHPESYVLSRMTEKLFLIAKLTIAAIFVTKLTALLLYNIHLTDFRGTIARVFTKSEKLITVLICAYLIVRYDTTLFIVRSKSVRTRTIVLAGVITIAILFAYLFLRLKARHAKVLFAALVVSVLVWIVVGTHLKGKSNHIQVNALPRTGLIDCIFITIVSWVYALDNASAFYRT
tara:strand:- start:1633 stop:2328 length:696 start_codon:yes stop_codon:yes gene_type:complete